MRCLLWLVVEIAIIDIKWGGGQRITKSEGKKKISVNIARDNKHIYTPYVTAYKVNSPTLSKQVHCIWARFLIKFTNPT